MVAGVVADHLKPLGMDGTQPSRSPPSTPREHRLNDTCSVSALTTGAEGLNLSGAHAVARCGFESDGLGSSRSTARAGADLIDV